MKGGIFGGTFDPPHAGHIAVAAAARDQLGLDWVELIPSALPPHRRPPAAPGIDRLAMVALAAAGEPRLHPSPREILRGGVSFTIETLLELSEERPADDIFLILGADSYDELPAWRESQRIQELAHLAVIPRPGAAGIDALRPVDRSRLRLPGQAVPPSGKAVYGVSMPPLPIAAREIREKLSQGQDPGAALAPSVLAYIVHRGLYRVNTRGAQNG